MVSFLTDFCDPFEAAGCWFVILLVTLKLVYELLEIDYFLDCFLLFSILIDGLFWSYNDYTISLFVVCIYSLSFVLAYSNLSLVMVFDISWSKAGGSSFSSFSSCLVFYMCYMSLFIFDFESFLLYSFSLISLYFYYNCSSFSFTSDLSWVTFVTSIAL